MSGITRWPLRIAAQIGAVALVGTTLLLGAPPALAGSSGTLQFSLSPDANVMAPGASITVTVRNTETRKSTTALVATLTNPAQFVKVDGCSGVALGPGKTCQITVTNSLTTVPAVDATATLTVAGKKPGTTSPGSVTFVVLGSGCHVMNGSTSYTDLQAAIEAAASGDTLDVSGTCPGNFRIDKDLTLNGVAGAGTAMLDAGLVGVVLTISESASVTLRNVTVTHGVGVGGQAIGGGIDNHGDLTLSGSTSVSKNFPSVGGGILNDGTVTMNDTSTVSDNSFDAGAGILNDAGGTVTMNDSSSVVGNTSRGDGGGIANAGTLVMNGSSSVSSNSAAGAGGGIVNSGVLVGATGGVNVFDNHPEDIVQL